MALSLDQLGPAFGDPGWDLTKNTSGLQITIKGKSQRELELLDSLRKYLNGNRGLELQNSLSANGITRVQLSHDKKKSSLNINNGTLFVKLSATTLSNIIKQFRNLVEGRFSSSKGKVKPQTQLPDLTPLDSRASLPLSSVLASGPGIGVPLKPLNILTCNLDTHPGLIFVEPTSVNPDRKEAGSIDIKLQYVPHVARALYKAVWESISPAVLDDGEKVFELSPGTGGQFKFYPHEHMSRVAAGLDGNLNNSKIITAKYRIPCLTADMFKDGWGSKFNDHFQNVTMPACIGTNGIYYAKSKKDLDVLVRQLDSVLKPGKKGIKGIFHVFCGESPHFSEWGNNNYYAFRNFKDAASKVLLKYGYESIFLDPIYSEAINEQSLTAEQRQLVKEGFYSAHYEGTGFALAEDEKNTILLREFGNYYLEKPLKNGFFQEELSAIVLIALKKC